MFSLFCCRDECRFVYRHPHCNPFRLKLSTSAKFGTCTVVSVNGTLVEDKTRRFKDECAHFNFIKYPIYTHDSASAKCSTNSPEKDYSAECSNWEPFAPPIDWVAD